MLPPTALWTAAVLLAAAVAVAALSPGGADAAFAFPNHESNGNAGGRTRSTRTIERVR